MNVCRLCANVCIDFRELCDAEGRRNEIYQVSANYFEKQLRNLKDGSRVICASCWERISDFHQFQLNVFAAQELLLFKLEEEIDFETVQAIGELEQMEIDPVEITGNFDKQNEFVEVKDDAGSSSSSEDNKPLLNRILPKTTANKPKTTPRKTKTERKQRRLQILENDMFIAQHWKRVLNCELCGQGCENFSAIQKHFREKHNPENGYVKCCQRKYHHRNHLIEHLQVHLNPQSFQCAECDKCMPNRRSLTSHIKAIHATQNKRFECDVCQKRFAKLNVLRLHMETHVTGSKDFLCPECGKGFVLESRLNIHTRNVHNKTCNSVCELCGKSFRGSYAVKRHLLEQHEGVTKRKWPCDQCDAQLYSKFSLGRHKRLAHHDGSTVYVCSECGKVALTEDALRSHKKYMHEKERKYKCNICDKAFKVAVVLKEHMTQHTGEDLYQCPHCPKTFKVSANMHHHRKRVHPKEWEANRQHRALASHTDLSLVCNEVVL